MNIVFLTNTYTPHVGGVARSVEAFTRKYREMGHRVMVVAPEFENMPENEIEVRRIPAIQNFNASDFSVALPIPTGLADKVRDFGAEIIHSHHPFLLGMTAVRLARTLSLPLFFTHHTLYEQYTHYVPGDSQLMQRFIIELSTRYANLANHVYAPSESIRDLLLERGVTSPVTVVPTGVQIENFSSGNGQAFRQKYGIGDEMKVIGHMGRLAPEKNLKFLARSVIGYLQKHPQSIFLLIGSGPSEADIRNLFSQAGLDERLILAGVQQGEDLAAGLNAMDVFAFASKSETQGMVLTEAMASGVPVVALDAPGAREVVSSEYNGILVTDENEADFSTALDWVLSSSQKRSQQLIIEARATAEAYSLKNSADKALSCYEALRPSSFDRPRTEEESWESIMVRIKTEWDILKSVSQAGEVALTSERK